MRNKAVAGIFVVTLLMAGCETGEEPAPEPDADETETEAEDAIARGGTIVVAISSDPGHLNPAITTSGATHTAAELLYNGLVELDDDLNPVPELATDWDVEDDGALYRFHLRDDVTWHDGEPFTSEDVRYSFEEVLTTLHSRTAASVGQALDAIETPDDHTVEFHFTEPYAPLLLQLDVTEAPIIPAHVYAGTDPEENPANTNPVGTGPFRFVSYSPDEEIRLERNEDYFKEDLPYLDEVVMRVVPDDPSAVIALEAGEVDWLWNVPGPDLERLQANDEVELLTTDRNPGGSNCIMTLSFNLENPFFADVDVRRAIAHAIDRDLYVEQILFGQGRVAEAPIASGIAYAHGDVDLPDFDVEQADELLEAAGWQREGDGVRVAQGVDGVEDGTALAFDFLHFPTFARYGELLRTQLAEVGIDLELRPLEPPVFAPTVFGDRDFDTNVISYCNGNDPEIGVRRQIHSEQIGSVPFSNAAAYANPRVDELLDEAQRTIDLDERGELYQELQEILAEELPYVWIVETEGTRAHSAFCDGFKPYSLFAEEAHCG
ncbi:MAG TPA: ABC transporter substrate-binding protein [Egibacteraceae bacterium]|nr:ABC transporter substrate-binding protein [Egibacteraceae bacterium]